MIPRHRMMITGDVNVGKTQALVDTLRWLRTLKPDARMNLLIFPGEYGEETVSPKEPGLKLVKAPHILDPKETTPKSLEIVSRTRRLVAELISDKPDIFAGDGLHKYFPFEFDAAIGGAYFKGEEFEGSAYVAGYERFRQFLSVARDSDVPLVLFTSWAKLKPERQSKPGEKARDVPMKIYPDFMGAFGRGMVGEVGTCVMQIMKRKAVDNAEGLYHPDLVSKQPEKGLTRMWQTRPHGDIAGVGIKGPQEVTEKIPTFIPARYQVLAEYFYPMKETSK